MVNRFRDSKEEDDQDWRRYKLLIEGTLNRHNEWLEEHEKLLHSLDKQLAVLVTKVTMYASISSAVAAVLGNIIVKAVEAGMASR